MTKRFKVYGLGIVVMVVLLSAIYFIYCRLEPAEIILAITALIIYIYTFETHELKEATVDHTKIYIRPVLMLIIETENRTEKVSLRLHNFGNSPAYNVEFHQTKFTLEDSQTTGRLKLQKAGVVPPEGEILVSWGEDGLEYDRVTSEELFTWINSSRIHGKRYSLKTVVTYDDILGDTWKTELGYDSTLGIIAKKPEAVKGKSLTQIERR